MMPIIKHDADGHGPCRAKIAALEAENERLDRMIEANVPEFKAALAASESEKASLLATCQSHRIVDEAALLAERDALAAFKAFVHRRLDEAGIPTHPNGPHSAAGCRIGDRLDIALKMGGRE